MPVGWMSEWRCRYWKGLTVSLRAPVGPCAVGQEVHCTNGSWAKTWGVSTCQQNLCIGEEKRLEGCTGELVWLSQAGGAVEKSWRDRWRGRWEQSRLRDQTRMFKPGLGTTPRKSVFNFAKEKTTFNPPTPAQSSCSLFLWLSLQAPQHPRALSEEPSTLRYN